MCGAEIHARVDCLLAKSPTAFALETVRTWLGDSGLEDLGPIRVVSTDKAQSGHAMHYLYVTFTTPQALGATHVQQLGAALQRIADHPLTISRLQTVLDMKGPSFGDAAGVHYVVETDPEAGWEREIASWYAEEHLPGLAAVNGTITAQRFTNLDHSPASFACYDLTSSGVLGCPEWLAVRGTAWSDICRPHFTNTLRTMFQRIETLA